MVPVPLSALKVTPTRRALTALRGRELLNEPTLNKGTAFTSEERTLLGLRGLLPQHIETLADQCVATRDRYDQLSGPLERHIFLRALEDTNEVLFYAFLDQHLEELLPVIYTPTVGEACQKFSHIYRRPHGLFLSYPNREDLAASLASVEGPVDVIVVTDGERILGLGDQGVGGMGIPIGKLALYTAAGGIDPRRSLPILLDVGTNNQDLLDDPLYLGWRHPRIDNREYDDFISLFVQSVAQRFPGAIVQWEDFGGHHAAAILERYRRVIPSFNDDIQGTAAVVLATVQSAVAATNSRLGAQRICIAGAGSAGCGIAAMLAEAMTRAGTPNAHRQIVLFDVEGMIHAGRPDLTNAQRPFAFTVGPDAPVGVCDLAAVVEWVGATVLIGVSGQAGLFDRDVITAMTAATGTPIVMPLSNPTTSAEATPADVLAWSRGRAIVATGSPFDDVDYDGVPHRISQANNVYIFPGLGMGAIAARATEITDEMLFAAAQALSAESPQSTVNGVLPPLADIRAVSHTIAVAVAKAAIAGGVAGIDDPTAIESAIAQSKFRPVYPTMRPSRRTIPRFT